MSAPANLKREAIAKAALDRACPDCGARKGERCFRTIRMADDGSVVTVGKRAGEPMAYLHQHRRFPTARGPNAERR